MPTRRPAPAFERSTESRHLDSPVSITNCLLYPPLRMLISSTQVQLHCRVDFFTYRNLFQNEISDDFSSKSLLKLLIHSNAHIHNYRSRKKKMNFGAWNLVPIVVKLNSTGTTWDRNLWPVSYQIHFQQIYTFRHYFDSLFSQNINYLLVIDRNNLDNISTICLPFKKKIILIIMVLVALFFRGGRKRLPKFKFSAKFPIGLHVILQIQIKKFGNDCYLMWKIILTENPSRFNVEPLLK